MKIQRPNSDEYSEYMGKYIQMVPDGDVLEQLYTEQMETYELITSLDEESLLTPYAAGKWNIKEIMQHLMDCERIFQYRALRFARYDVTELSGFDQDAYVVCSLTSLRKIEDIMQEFTIIRASGIQLFRSFSEEMLMQKGQANGKVISVRALIYATLGHELHHRKVIQEKYLK